ncbi:hypothetical protein PsYK624_106450 [Phanerochaete sordida]|uniref:Uncharacterized protein n=1 Tax=Phanerochaete sordida TaxID=48140 RepID=A0A9P3GGF0_9APHY|nr:hypothetical protein PsYK624_106450 [Phanerochaete sordida]
MSVGGYGHLQSQVWPALRDITLRWRCRPSDSCTDHSRLDPPLVFLPLFLGFRTPRTKVWSLARRTSEESLTTDRRKGAQDCVPRTPMDISVFNVVNPVIADGHWDAGGNAETRTYMPAGSGEAD